MASLLSLIQDACDRIGLVRPSSVVGSSDHQVRQLLAVANQEGREQARRHSWQVITFEKTFTTIAQESQTGALPADFDRFVPDTFYNRTKVRLVSGPMSAPEWADYKGRLASIVFDAFRVRGDAILIAPVPPAGETMAYEYVSKYWAGGAADTVPDQAEFLADTDITFLDRELTTQGIVWRFQKARGLDYGENFQQYELHLATLAGRDGGTRSIRMTTSDGYRPRAPMPPDGNWNIS